MSEKKKVYVETTVVSDWSKESAEKQDMNAPASALRKCFRKEAANDSDEAAL